MIKLVSFFFILAYGVSVALASGDISQFIFTTNSQTIKPNEVSAIITIQAQNADGDYATSTQTICIELASVSDTGEFSSNNTNWSSVKVLTMNKGWANRNFYYKDSTVGAYELSLKISLKPESKPACASWPKEEWDIKWNIKQSIIVSPNSSSSSVSSQNSSSVSSVANSSGGSIIWPTEPQIYANAGKDKTGIVGADVLFEGKALGIKKEPLENAYYFWNFGDGSSGEGQNVKHVYKYPGSYIAFLEVSSGYSTSDRVDVKISANELIVSEANNDFIKLKNKSGVILDISGWFLTGGGVLFKFPKSSFIAANAELNISSDISKIKFAGNDIKVNLLYSNGSVAFSYFPSPVLSSSSKPKETVSSKQSEKIINTAVAPANPVVLQKNYSVPALEKIGAQTKTFGAGKNLPAGEAGLASVITIGDKNNPGAKIWLILAVITGIIGGTGVFLARRKTI